MKMFGNLEFGPVKDINISHLGIALKNAAGNMVSYDKKNGEIVDVDLIDFNAENMVYAIPCAIKDIKVGDTIRHVNGNAVFVTDVENGIHVVDIMAGEKKEIFPTKSIFGFDFVTKIVSLIDFSAINASTDQPFGNMPLLMLLGDNKSSMKDLLSIMMLTNNGVDFGNFDMNNLPMLIALMGNGGSEGKNFFQMMMIMQFMKRQKQPVKKASTEEKKEE